MNENLIECLKKISEILKHPITVCPVSICVPEKLYYILSKIDGVEIDKFDVLWFNNSITQISIIKDILLPKDLIFAKYNDGHHEFIKIKYD